MADSSHLYSGLEGSLWVIEEGDWMKVAAVKNWAFTQNQQVLETTTLGDTDRTLVDGVRSLSGSCSLFYYNLDQASTDDTGAGRLLKRILKPLSIVDGGGFTGDDYRGESTGATGVRSMKTAFRLSANKDLSRNDEFETSNTERYLWVNAWITSFQMTMAVGEVQSCEVTFEADGTSIANGFSTYFPGDK